MDENIQLTSQLLTVPLCPLYVPNLSPVSEYHTQGNSALLQENNKSPSLLNFTWVMDLSCPLRTMGLCKIKERLSHLLLHYYCIKLNQLRLYAVNNKKM